MATRQATLLIRDKQTSGGVLPAGALMAEPFVNLFDGILKFSGVTGGGFEPSDVSTVFEVGSTLYNSKIINRFNINDNFIISGGTGLISTYGGITGAGLDGKFMSGTTDGFVLGEISDISGVSDITRVAGGTNISTGGTANDPIVNLDDDIVLASVNAVSISGNTLYSGATNIEDIFLTAGDLSGTSVSAGSNTSVNNVGTDYEVSVVNSPSFNNIEFSGTATGGNTSFTDMSATTLYSGSTDLSDLFVTVDTNDITRVQGGTNIATGGTANEPIINLDADILLTSVNAASVSGDTLYSGSTDLSDLFVTVDTNDITRVQGGTNINTGGTANEPIINLDDSPSFAGLVSATGFTDSSLTDGRVTYAGVGGRLTDEAGFEYDAGANLLKTKNIQIGDATTTGNTTTTIFGNLVIVGDAITATTSQLYIEDNFIELNFNPTASTASTSLGAGWSIQDGSGVDETDVLFDIRGTATGLDNRSFATNLNDIRIRETGTISAPNGLRVIAETDCIDGGSY